MLSKLAYALVLIGGSATAAKTGPIPIQSWAQWKRYFNRSYPKTIETTKELNFITNANFVENHNRRFLAGEETYYVELNRFADMSKSEFYEMFLKNNEDASGAPHSSGSCSTHYQSNNYQESCPGCFDSNNDPDFDQIYDWSDGSYNSLSKNVVTEVKDQGSCGSCWAFAGTAVLESFMCINEYYDCDSWTGISAQNVVDCNMCKMGRNDLTGTVCSNGCGGGWGQNTWFYVQAQGGVDSWDGYPYVSGSTKVNGDCEYNPEYNVLANGGQFSSSVCTQTKTNDEKELVDAIYNNGPLKVSIDASSRGFGLYSGGVYTDSECSNTGTNHAVTAVGYGNANGMDFYKIKNSWGSDWGVDGYILFRRNYNSMCAVAKYPYFPNFE